MKKLLFVVGLVAGAALAQDVTKSVQMNPSSAVVEQSLVGHLPDGGCVLRGRGHGTWSNGKGENADGPVLPFNGQVCADVTRLGLQSVKIGLDVRAPDGGLDTRRQADGGLP